MSHEPPGTLRVLRILAGNSALRLLRIAHVQRSKRQREVASKGAGKPGGKRAREATRRKSGSGLTVLMLLLLPVFAFQAYAMSHQAVEHLWAAANRTAPSGAVIVMPEGIRSYELYRISSESEDELRELLDENGIDEASRPPRSAILRAFRDHGPKALKNAKSLARDGELRFYTNEARWTFAKTAGLLLALLALMSLCTAFGGANASLGGGDWIQWWLMTFPVPTRSLTLARAFEYALVQLFPWFTLFPLTWQVLATLGQPWALPIAAGAALTPPSSTGPCGSGSRPSCVCAARCGPSRACRALARSGRC